MCGIVGFAGEGGTEHLRAMNEAIRHRGPDDSGQIELASHRVYLAMSRLEIVDIESGRQPMWDWEQRFCIVFNGEIYNHVELRAQLEAEGCRFLSDHSDTEVVLVGFRHWGLELMQRLNGMWAFCIYDKRTKTLTLSRDRFGQKPLFYHHRPGFFAFGSELKALTRHPGVPRELSYRALRKYFGYGYVPSPLSLVTGVAKLSAGHWLQVQLSSGQIRDGSYWSYHQADLEHLPEDPWQEWGAELRRLLNRAVERRLLADVDVGVFLSGGVDSSTITAMALSQKKGIKTFSLGFENPSFDESGWASEVAEQFGSNHFELCASDEMLLEAAQEIAERLDEPFGDQSVVPTYLLSRLASQHVKVALGGDGADELFGGYDPFAALHLAKWYQTLMPKPVHTAIRLLMARLPVTHGHISLEFKIKRTLRGLNFGPQLWLPTWMGPLEAKEIAVLLSEPIRPEDLYSEAIEHWDAHPNLSMVDRAILFYLRFYLQDDILTKIDRASMLHSLEVRSPFLDIELVDFVRRIPSQYKCHRGKRKRLLKKAVSPLLGARLVNRKKKGFGAPVGPWFKSGELALPNQPCLKLDWEFARRLEQAHRSGKEDHRTSLWSIWFANRWMNHFQAGNAGSR